VLAREAHRPARLRAFEHRLDLVGAQDRDQYRAAGAAEVGEGQRWRAAEARQHASTLRVHVIAMYAEARGEQALCKRSTDQPEPDDADRIVAPYHRETSCYTIVE
jgi:hypothetical protein